MEKSLILGFFDGVHIAHQAVISSAVSEPVLITFKTSPAEFFNKNCEYIYSRTDSIEKMKSLGVKDVVELDFGSIANMRAEEYLESLIKKYAPTSISTGFNHTFGFERSGGPKLLEACQAKYGYKYFCTPPLMDNGEVVSSTLIKNLIKTGELERANRLLGSSFLLRGTVIHGAQLGRKLGFPTANIKYPQKIVNMPYGVYKGKVLGRNAILNWGVKPTVNDSFEPIVEVHILDFNRDIYGQEIKIEVIKKIRDEKKFNTIDDLKTQIEKDVLECLK